MGDPPGGPVVLLDANVLLDIMRGNLRVVDEIRDLQRQGAQVEMTWRGFIEVVNPEVFGRHAVAAQYVMRSLDIGVNRVVPPAEVLARVQADVLSLNRAGGVVHRLVQEKDASHLAETLTRGDARFWSFEFSSPQRAAELESRLGVHLYQPGIPTMPKGSPVDVRLMQRVGLVPADIEISFAGRVSGAAGSGALGAIASAVDLVLLTDLIGSDSSVDAASRHQAIQDALRSHERQFSDELRWRESTSATGPLWGYVTVWLGEVPGSDSRLHSFYHDHSEVRFTAAAPDSDSLLVEENGFGQQYVVVAVPLNDTAQAQWEAQHDATAAQTPTPDPDHSHNDAGAPAGTPSLPTSGTPIAETTSPDAGTTDGVATPSNAGSVNAIATPSDIGPSDAAAAPSDAGAVDAAAMPPDVRSTDAVTTSPDAGTMDAAASPDTGTTDTAASPNAGPLAAESYTPAGSGFGAADPYSGHLVGHPHGDGGGYSAPGGPYYSADGRHSPNDPVSALPGSGFGAGGDDAKHPGTDSHQHGDASGGGGYSAPGGPYYSADGRLSPNDPTYVSSGSGFGATATHFDGAQGAEGNPVVSGSDAGALPPADL
ncbi:hypothetical protein [Acrocarpospora sp. B8E8]|uniref:hypothetical protein n=1 Tax=Acrocarpospora sp. B8E8 TaxID=3153572 RepID=UPI00325E505F